MARKSRKNIDNSVSFENTLGKTALYIRLSVEDNKKRGNSIENQKQILEDYIKNIPELEICNTYCDNGQTGRNFDRPAFSQMIEDIEQKKIDCVLVKDLSRLGRNSIDTGYYIEKFFPLNDVRFISVSDNFDSLTDLNSANGIVLPLKNMINEAYSYEIGRKIKAQQQQAMKAGDFVGSRSPYGYKKSADNCHKLVIDDESAEIVKLIFQMAYERNGLNAIVKRLNEDGVLTPALYAEKQGIINQYHLDGGRNWQTRTINKILLSDVYIGNLVQGKSQSVNRRQKPNSQEKWITVENTHEPIISRELFESVQTIREEMSVKNIGCWTENILKGKIFCKYCGKNLHRQKVKRAKGDIYIYHCISNNRIAKGHCEGHIFYREDDLLNDLLVKIENEYGVVSSKNSLFQQQIMSKENDADKAKELAKIVTEITNAKKYLKSLYENLISGVITTEEYKDMKLGYEGKIDTLQKKHIELENIQKSLKNQVITGAKLESDLSKINQKTPITRELVERLIESIVIYSDKSMDVTFLFNKALPMLDEVADNE